MRVLVADDSALFRGGVVRVLTAAGFDVAGEASDGDSLVELVAVHDPDVVVVDIRMPPTWTHEGLVAAGAIKAGNPDVGVLVLSQYVETEHAMALLAGDGRGVGYLLKDRVADLDEFTDAVTRVGKGGSAIDPSVVAALLQRERRSSPLDDLTGREREVLALMAEGLSNDAISERLFTSPRTVETHVRGIFMKLSLPPSPEAHRRVLAVLTYLRS